MKKIMVGILAVGLSFGASGNVSASSVTPVSDNNVKVTILDGPVNTNNFDKTLNFGVSKESPLYEISTYDTSRPTKSWNIPTKGQYDFAGVSKGTTMYTNYTFKGKTSYTVKINNKSSNSLTVKAKRLTKTYASTKISGGKSATIQFSNIEKATEFYVTFDGVSMSFDGYVK